VQTINEAASAFLANKRVAVTGVSRLGYRASYPRHLQTPVESVELEPLPDGIEVPGA
jgi:hypothetical protein